MADKKYFNELNIFRALIIIWVVIGHSTDETQSLSFALHSYAYTFHMSAFFLLSGMLFSKKIRISDTFKSKISAVKDRAQRLIVPYLFFTVVSYLLKLVFGEYANNTLPKGKEIVVSILTGTNNPNGGIWFLYFLFLYSVVALLINFIPNAVSLCVIAALNILSRFVNLGNYVPLFIYYLLFFYIGLVLFDYYENLSDFINNKCKSKSGKTNLIFLSLFFIVASLVLFYCKMNISFCDNLLFKLTIAIVNTICWYLISQLVYQFKIFDKFFSVVGNYGMDIYMIGYYVQISLRVILKTMLGMPTWVYGICMAVFGLLLPIPISKYIVRKFKITRILVLGDFKDKYSSSKNK